MLAVVLAVLPLRLPPTAAAHRTGKRSRPYPWRRRAHPMSAGTAATSAAADARRTKFFGHVDAHLESYIDRRAQPMCRHCHSEAMHWFDLHIITGGWMRASTSRC